MNVTYKLSETKTETDRYKSATILVNETPPGAVRKYGDVTYDVGDLVGDPFESAPEWQVIITGKRHVKFPKYAQLRYEPVDGRQSSTLPDRFLTRDEAILFHVQRPFTASYRRSKLPASPTVTLEFGDDILSGKGPDTFSFNRAAYARAISLALGEPSNLWPSDKSKAAIAIRNSNKEKTNG